MDVDSQRLFKGGFTRPAQIAASRPSSAHSVSGPTAQEKGSPNKSGSSSSSSSSEHEGGAANEGEGDPKPPTPCKSDRVSRVGTQPPGSTRASVDEVALRVQCVHCVLPQTAFVVYHSSILSHLFVNQFQIRSSYRTRCFVYTGRFRILVVCHGSGNHFTAP
jgi:hypothetical protein